mmetsp:Transcript_27783/g.80207  ORF Transcript_27783/g.80207 Transcript_27783/m.80207 type:complete len:434 (+) Transcript_27783:381-1682(+)
MAPAFGNVRGRSLDHIVLRSTTPVVAKVIGITNSQFRWQDLRLDLGIIDAVQTNLIANAMVLETLSMGLVEPHINRTLPPALGIAPRFAQRRFDVLPVLLLPIFALGRIVDVVPILRTALAVGLVIEVLGRVRLGRVVHGVGHGGGGRWLGRRCGRGGGRGRCRTGLGCWHCRRSHAGRRRWQRRRLGREVKRIPFHRRDVLALGFDQGGNNGGIDGGKGGNVDADAAGIGLDGADLDVGPATLVECAGEEVGTAGPGGRGGGGCDELIGQAIQQIGLRFLQQGVSSDIGIVRGGFILEVKDIVNGLNHLSHSVGIIDLQRGRHRIFYFSANVRTVLGIFKRKGSIRIQPKSLGQVGTHFILPKHIVLFLVFLLLLLSCILRLLLLQMGLVQIRQGHGRLLILLLGLHLGQGRALATAHGAGGIGLGHGHVGR